jgi:protein-tyrosine phosphatase
MYTANRIVDNLYIGGMPPYGHALADAGIKVLVLCAAENQDAQLYPGVRVIVAPGDDDPRPGRFSRFVDMWVKASDEVAKCVSMGEPTLVTCMAGQNRSGFVVAMALRKLTGWSGRRTVEYVQSHRLHALNNTTFANYVIDSFPIEKPIG